MSKGGDSSSSASAQTPAQWAAALSNASIAAWKEADILAISVDKLKALSTSQISQIVVPWALPGEAWTADTLNAVPLQYWSKFGTRYLSTNTNGTVVVAPTSQVSNNTSSGKNNWFDDLGYGYQSGTGRFTFSPSVISGISLDRIQAIGGGLGTASHAPAVNGTTASMLESALGVATSSGENIVSWDIAVSASDKSLGVSERKVYMFASGWADMGRDFMGALTASQLGAIANPEVVLGATQFGYLTANQLIALRQMNWASVSAEQINAITGEAFSGLQSNIIAAISETAWSNLDKVHTLRLSTADIRLLSASKIAQLKYLGYALNSSFANVLTANQVASIKAECWAQLSDPSFLNALPISVFQAIPASAFSQMSVTALQSLDSLHIQSLTSAQLLTFPLSVVVGSSAANSLFNFNPSTINFAAFVANANVNWSLAPASFMSLLTAAQLRMLSPNQISQLSLVAIAALRTAQISALLLAQVQAMSVAQLNAAPAIWRRTDLVKQVFTIATVVHMKKSFWQGVTSEFLNALDQVSFQAITQTQISVISPSAFANLDKAHFDMFTITQLLALTAPQVGAFRGEYLTIQFLRTIRLDSFKGLVIEQIRRLHDYLFNTVVANAFDTANDTLLQLAENQFATLLATIMDSDDGREAWLQQSTALLLELKWLAPTRASSLSATDVRDTYSPLNWAWMSGSFLNNIMTTVFSQVRATSIAQLNLEAVAALDDARLQVLTSTQVVAMSSQQLSAITNLGALQVSAVQALTRPQIFGMTIDWAMVPSEFLSNMTALQLAGMRASQFAQLTSTQLATAHIDWSLMSADAWNVLSEETFTQLCTGANPAILQASVDALLGLNGTQFAILANASKSYTLAQNHTLLTHLLGGYSDSQRLQLLDTMGNDSIDQLILQLGTVNVLAKIEGSANAFDIAIQTVLTGRTLNPDWFSSVNLSRVLPAINDLYLQNIEARNLATTQTLFYQIFGGYQITAYLASRNYSIERSNVALSAYIETTNIGGQVLRNYSAEGRLLPPAVERYVSGDFRAQDLRIVTSAARLSLVDQMTRALTSTPAYINASDPARPHSDADRSYVAAIDETLATIRLRVSSMGVPARQNKELEAIRANSNVPESELRARGNTPEVMQRRLLSEVGVAFDDVALQKINSLSSKLNLLEGKTTAAQSALAIGGLLVMFGAAVNDIGQAIFGADDLSGTDKNNLLAASILGAVYNVAQGLSLPVAMVVEAVGRWYTGDPSYADLSLGGAIVKRFFGGFATLYNAGRNNVQAGGNVADFYTQVALEIRGAPRLGSATPIIPTRRGFSTVQATGDTIDGLEHSIAQDLTLQRQRIPRLLSQSATMRRSGILGGRSRSTTSLISGGVVDNQTALLITTNIERFLDENVKQGYFNEGLEPVRTPIRAVNGLIVGYETQNIIGTAGSTEEIRLRQRAVLLEKAQALLTTLRIEITPDITDRMTRYFTSVLANEPPSFYIEDLIFRAIQSGTLVLDDQASVARFVADNVSGGSLSGRVDFNTLTTIVNGFPADKVASYISSRNSQGAYQAATNVEELNDLMALDLAKFGLEIQDERLATRLQDVRSSLLTKQVTTDARQALDVLVGRLSTGKGQGLPHVRDQMVELLVAAEKANVLQAPDFQQKFTQIVAESLLKNSGKPRGTYYSVQELLDTTQAAFEVANARLESEGKAKIALFRSNDADSAYSVFFKNSFKELLNLYGYKLTLDAYEPRVAAFERGVSGYLLEVLEVGKAADVNVVARLWRETWETFSVEEYRVGVVRANARRAQLEFSPEIANVLRDPPRVAGQDVYGKALTYSKQLAARSLALALINDDYGAPAVKDGVALPALQEIKDWLEVCIKAGGDYEPITLYYDVLRNDIGKILVLDHIDNVNFEVRGTLDVDVAQLAEDTGQNLYRQGQLTIDTVLPAPKTKVFLPTIRLASAELLPEVPVLRETPSRSNTSVPTVEDVVVSGTSSRVGSSTYGLTDAEFEQVQTSFKLSYELQISEYRQQVGTLKGEALEAAVEHVFTKERQGNAFAEYLRDYISGKMAMQEARVGLQLPEEITVVDRAPSTEPLSPSDKAFFDGKQKFMQYLLRAFKTEFEKPSARFPHGRSASGSLSSLAAFVRYAAINMDRLVQEIARSIALGQDLPARFHERPGAQALLDLQTLAENWLNGNFKNFLLKHGEDGLIMLTVSDGKLRESLPFYFDASEAGQALSDVIGLKVRIGGLPSEVRQDLRFFTDGLNLKLNYATAVLDAPINPTDLARVTGISQNQLINQAEVIIAEKVQASNANQLGKELIDLVVLRLRSYAEEIGGKTGWTQDSSAQPLPLDEALTQFGRMLEDPSSRAIEYRKGLLRAAKVLATKYNIGLTAEGKLATEINIQSMDVARALVRISAATSAERVLLGTGGGDQLAVNQSARTFLDNVVYKQPQLKGQLLGIQRGLVVNFSDAVAPSVQTPRDTILVQTEGTASLATVLAEPDLLSQIEVPEEERAGTGLRLLSDPQSSEAQEQAKQRAIAALEYKGRSDIADMVRNGHINLQALSDHTRHLIFSSDVPGNALDEFRILSDSEWVNIFNKMSDRSLGDRLTVAVRANSENARLGIFTEAELQALTLSVDGSAEGDAVLINFLKENIAQKRINLSGLTDADDRPVSFPELAEPGGGAEVGVPVESDLQKSIRLGNEFTKLVAIYASRNATVELNTPERAATAIYELLTSNLGSRSHEQFELLTNEFFAENALVRDEHGKTTQLRITRQTVANAVEAMRIHGETHPQDYTAAEILADLGASDPIDRATGRLNRQFVTNVGNDPEIMRLEEDSLRPTSVDQRATTERRAAVEEAGAQRLLQLVRASGGDTRAVEGTLETFAAGRTVAGDALEISPARVRAVEAALDETDSGQRTRRAPQVAENEANLDFERNIAQAEGKLSRLGTAVYSLGLLGFGIFASVVGIAAGIAGIVYAASSTKLSNQAKYLTISMNAVRVASSVLILGASAAQIAANVAKTAVEVAQATTIAERGFYLGGIIGITTSLAQIGLQAKAVDDATDSTSRLIAGLAILDAVIQLVLNVVGLLGLVFGGPLGVVINLVTFVIGALVPSFSAIAQAVKYREVYDELVGKGLNKEAEIVFVNWQIAVMDATPIVNWGSTIYTPEWERDQQSKMDHAWLDKAGEERLLYFVKTSTDLLRNFNELRQQLYAGAAAINQPVVNLSQGLTRATMLMLSQEDLSYFSGDVTATVKLAATFNYNANKIERVPKLISAVVNGAKVTLTFNQNLATLASQLPDLTAFTVTVNGVAVTVSGFTLLNNLITLSLVTGVTAGQVVTFSYLDSTANDDKKAVQTLLGKDAANISNHAVVNLLDTDARAPLLVDAVVQTKYLSLTFDEALDSNASKVPNKSQFSVSVGGTNANIASVAVYGSRVLLTLVDDVNTGDAVVVNYTSPSTGASALQDALGNKVLSFVSGSGTAVNVENTTTVATVTASRVGWLQYDNFVKSVQGTGTEASSVLNGSDYTVYSNASAANNGSARLRYLSLGNVAGEFDSYSVSRADNNPDKVWLDASKALGTVSFAVNTSKMMVWGGQSYNSYSLQRDYANDAYIVAANSWSGESNVVTISSNSSSDPNANTTVNLDHLLTASDISEGLPINQMAFKVLGASDGKDKVIGTFTNQTYYATSNVANINLSGANSSVFVGESATVKVGMNARVLVDMDMWRALSATAPTANVINGTIKGNYGSSSILNFSSTDTINDSFMGALDLQYTLGHLPNTNAFSVSVAGTSVAVNEVEVTERNVVLKLAQSVEQGQTVSISYVDGAADDEDTLQSLNGVDVSSFSSIVVNNLTSDTAVPSLVSATMSSNVLWLRFDRQLNTSVSVANLKSALSVVVGGEPVLITGVSVQDNKIAVTTGTLPTRDQVVTVSYRPLVQTIVSTSGVAADSIGNFPVTNLIDDVFSPVVTSAIANDNLIVLVFSEDLRNNAISGTSLTDYSLGGFNVSGFSVEATGQQVTVNDVAISGNSLVLTLNKALTQEQSVTVSYTAPPVASGISDGSVLRDWAGNDVSGFVIGSTSAPKLISAQGYGNQVLLTYDSALQISPRPDLLPAGFSVVSPGTVNNTAQNVSVRGNTVLLTMNSTLPANQSAMRVTYSSASLSNSAFGLFGANGVAVSAANELISYANASFSNTMPVLELDSVNNISGRDVTAPNLSYAVVNGTSLVLTFDETLSTVRGFMPTLAAFRVILNGTTNVELSNMVIVDNTVVLTLRQAVSFSDTASVSYLDLSANVSGNVLQDIAGNNVSAIRGFSVVNSTPDNIAPTLSSLTIDGNQLVMRFSEFLNATAGRIAPITAFTVKKNGVAVSIISGSLADDVIALTLANAVQASDFVTMDYTAPATSELAALQDSSGNHVASILGYAVQNTTGLDTTAPTLTGTAVDGNAITLTFSESLTSTSAVDPAAFVIYVDGGNAAKKPSNVSVSGQQVSLTLKSLDAIAPGQAVVISYVPTLAGTGGALRDLAGNALASFTRRPVANLTSDITAPAIASASIEGARLDLTFTERLASTAETLPALTQFRVTVDGSEVDLVKESLSNKVLTLFLNKAVTGTQTVSVDYVQQAVEQGSVTSNLQDSYGNTTNDFSLSTSTTATSDTVRLINNTDIPSLQSAAINGNTLTMTFNQLMDGKQSDTPALSNFIVLVSGNIIAPTAISVEDHSVYLTLPASVSNDDQVILTYADPTTSDDRQALQNLSGVDVKLINNYVVLNETPRSTVRQPPVLTNSEVVGDTLTLTYNGQLDTGVGRWLASYSADGSTDNSGNPLITSKLQASGFVNLLGSNGSNDTFTIGDQSTVSASRQLKYIQLGSGSNVQVTNNDTSQALVLAFSATGRADVTLESGSSLQVVSSKLVQTVADESKFKANRDTLTLKSLSNLTAFLGGYEKIDASISSSSISAEIDEGDHQIELGGQTASFKINQVSSTTTITAPLIPNSWTEYQFLNFQLDGSDLWLGREADGTVLFRGAWNDFSGTGQLKLDYDGALNDLVMQCNSVLVGQDSSKLRVDKLVEVMAAPGFAGSNQASTNAMTVTDTSNSATNLKLYRINDIVNYSLTANQI